MSEDTIRFYKMSEEPKSKIIDNSTRKFKILYFMLTGKKQVILMAYVEQKRLFF